MRKEVSTRILLNDGRAVNVRVMDGFIIDDLLIQGAKAEAFRISTGRDVYPTFGRGLKDYLIKTGLILE